MQWLLDNWVSVLGFVGTTLCTISSWFAAKKSDAHAQRSAAAADRATVPRNAVTRPE